MWATLQPEQKPKCAKKGLEEFKELQYYPLELLLKSILAAHQLLSSLSKQSDSCLSCFEDTTSMME